MARLYRQPAINLSGEYMFNSPVLPRVIPFALYILILVVEGNLPAGMTGFLPDGDLRWLYLIKISLVTLSLILLWPYFIELKKPGKFWPGDLALSVGIGALVFVLWINLDFSWAVLGGMNGYTATDGAGNIIWFLAAIRLFGAAIIVPIMEELFWRSFLLRWVTNPDFVTLSAARISLRAFLITAVLFGFEHNLWLAGIIAGAAYNWLYMKSDNLWIPIISHAVTNAMLGIWVLQTGNWQFW